jgi:hypothetical protein
MKLFLLICVAYGITSFFVESVMFLKPRNLLSKIDFFNKLLRCMFCTGFWVGCGIHFYSSPFNEYFGNIWFNAIFDGFFFATTTWFLSKIDGIN